VLVLRLTGAALAISLMAAATGHAQSPPSSSVNSSSNSSPSSQALPLRAFVPPYEILRTVRAAGFDPLAPPLRQGTIYVVRAVDYRGIAMRVVVDAHSGAIRDANRIVSGLGLYGPYAPGPYAPPYYGRIGAPPPYPPPDDVAPRPYAPPYYGRIGAPPRYPPPDEVAAYGGPPYVGTADLPAEPNELQGAAQRSPRLTGSIPVPLPRPRPARPVAAAGVSDAKAFSKPASPDIAASAPTLRSEPPSKAAKTLPAIND
jgi:hypothetical protein